MNSTCYHHTIGSEFFLESLEILSELLVSPLFDKNFVDKEVNCIESEQWCDDGDDERLF